MTPNSINLSAFGQANTNLAMHLLHGAENPTWLKKRRGAEYFYALEWHNIPSTHQLLKIGKTSNLDQRITDHRVSFPGWQYSIIVGEQAEERENFWKAYFKEWPLNGSPEVFVAPNEHIQFFKLFASADPWSQIGYDLEPATLRSMPWGQRIARFAQACAGPADYQSPSL